MVETPLNQAEQHCKNCGAVVYEGATWCGMCFAPVGAETPIAEPQPKPDVKPGWEPGHENEAVATVGAPPEAPMWPCPVCATRNPIALDYCATCGASFAALMRQEPAQVKVDPQQAFRRSLLFPGLGHRIVPGRAIDGFSRGVLFAMLLIATLMLGFSGVHAGAVFFLFLLYLSATVLVYLVTAFEASRLAQGGEPLVSSRTLLWTTVGILLLSVVVVSLVIGTAARR